MSKNTNKVFLGGTCAQTTWRDDLIPVLRIPYFNPVVENWTAECQQIERDEKDYACNIHFYLITKEMTGVFSIAEVVDSVHTKDKRTFLHVMPDGFSKTQLKSLSAVVDLVNSRGGTAFIDDEFNEICECFELFVFGLIVVLVIETILLTGNPVYQAHYNKIGLA